MASNERIRASAVDLCGAGTSAAIAADAGAVRSHLEYVLDGHAGELEPDQRRVLEAAWRNSRRFLKFAEDLRDLVLAESGELPLSRRACDLPRMAADAIQRFWPVAAAGRTTIALEVEGTPAPTETQPWLPRAVNALVEHAVEHASAGTAISVHASETGLTLAFVTDASPLDDPLGLALASALAKLHGGRLLVEPSEGRTTLTLRSGLLPPPKPPRAPSSAAWRSWTGAGDHHRGRRAGSALRLPALAGEGARLALGARRVERLGALARELGGDHLVAPLDVTDPGSSGAFVDRATRELGRIDILVNNAGLALGRAPIAEGSDDDDRTMVEVNVLGLVRMTRLVLPHMEDGRGHIVNLGSWAGRETCARRRPLRRDEVGRARRSPRSRSSSSDASASRPSTPDQSATPSFRTSGFRGDAEAGRASIAESTTRLRRIWPTASAGS